MSKQIVTDLLDILTSPLWAVFTKYTHQADLFLVRFLMFYKFFSNSKSRFKLQTRCLYFRSHTIDTSFIYLWCLQFRYLLSYGLFDQRILVGNSKEMKTLERETSSAFGTKENNLSFPPEHCASFTISQESKTLVRSLVSASFAKSEVSTHQTHGQGALPSEKSQVTTTLQFDSLFCVSVGDCDA